MDKIIEKIWIAVLADDGVFTGIPVRSWRDASKDEVYPVILVHCSEFNAETEDPLTGELFNCLVEIGARTSENYDKDKETLSEWLNKLMSKIFDKDNPIRTLLNTAGSDHGIVFNGLVFGKGSSGTADGINTSSFTLNCHIQKTAEILS